jgi:N-acetylmuramoyl-L-alanine amidase
VRSLLYPIQQLKSPNFEDRYGQVPILFVLHITDGQDAVRNSDTEEESAVDNTFMSPASQCSAHGGIERDGRIKQYVDITKTAWTQGLHSVAEELAAPSVIVRNMAGVNPNYYSIGIEFLAYKDHGGDGNITEEQFWAGCWLMKYWQDQVQQIYKHKIPLNSTYVIGHCHVDPVYRKFDPGANFPWQRLYSELAIADSMTLQDYEGRIQYLRSDQAKQAQAFAIANEVLYLFNLSKGTDGAAEWARNILCGLHPVMTNLGLLNTTYDASTAPGTVYNEVLYLYNTGNGKDGNGEWARQQLLKLYPYMLSQGLVNAP